MAKIHRRVRSVIGQLDPRTPQRLHRSRVARWAPVAALAAAASVFVWRYATANERFATQRERYPKPEGTCSYRKVGC